MADAAHSRRGPGNSKTFFVGFFVEKGVTFPDSLMMLEKEWKGAFFRCKLDQVVLPGNAWAGGNLLYVISTGWMRPRQSRRRCC